MSRSARAPCVPKHFCACWGRSRIAWLTCSPAGVPPTDAMARIPIGLYKHQQLQVILKPTPDDVIDQYLGSLKAIGIDLSKHDIKFEEDNWESPTLGAWGIGWQVMLDGLEITQFTYFQQCGGIDLDLVPAEITYGLERLSAFLQGVESVYDMEWAPGVKYSEVRLADEVQFSVYNFEMANVDRLWRLLAEHEAECKELLAGYEKYPEKHRYPVLAAYDQVLKCSHLFNLLDARGAISVTERVGVIKRVRDLAVGTAKIWADQQQSEGAAA